MNLTESDKHEGGWHSEGQRVALGLPQARGRPEDGSQDGGNHGAKVDGEVEDVEEGAHLRLLLRERELLCAKGDHAGLDASCAKGDEEETDEGNCSEKNRVYYKGKVMLHDSRLTLEASLQFRNQCPGRNPGTRLPARWCR